ncbi:DUF5665 domain-containing protein [Paraclostridium bifermentans]|uniref:DUF5665 domain-containing protein n=1 Tax=Paraclostridium bifermentans TaxID=1490 RepID=UPI00115BD322|nr:DUF5665 domain-containing protein [Paraclostridium bifermentans]MCR1876083.1 DUF5665 domain-containing protein [Paraclostridium bifermentans]TQO58616.1 hypothetical protein D5S05_03060 [Paraclostridium bifermentans]GKZ03653.1 hypothetical protein ANS014_20870 [Paraclostridium bifermentans]GKZ05197.1 hypothetical protein ANS015_00800 [Paraclostridium bifermentans]GKZ10191.1 hypothetical protein ANS017_15750 [Paraclostridium bifermentans]
MKRYRLGNRKNEKEIYIEEVKAVSMKEIDKKIHGDDESSALLKALEIANNRIDSLLYMFERSRIMDYMILTDSRRRMFAINFIAGIGKGFGQAIGFSFLTGLVLYIVSKWVNLPIIGEYIAEFLDMVDNFRGR